MNTSDSMAIDQSLISTDGSDNESLVYIDRPDIEHVPFLLRINYACRSLNIRVILSKFTKTSLFLSIAAYGFSNDERVLFFSLVMDFACNIIGFRYLMRYPQIFRTDRNNFLIPAMIAEKISFFFRSVLTILLIMSYYFKVAEAGWCFFGLAIILVGSTHIMGQSMAYTSIYNLIVLMTLVFVLLKIHCEVDLEWRVVFWFQRGYSWLCMAVALCYLIFWVALTGKKFHTGVVTATWKSIGMNSAQCVLVFLESMIIFYLQDFIEKEGESNEKSLGYIALATAFGHSGYLILGIMLRNSLIFSISLSDNIKVKNGLNYKMKVVQVTATSFIRSSSYSKEFTNHHSTFPRRVACFICNENASDCLIMNCLHSGICQTCAPAWLKMNHLCPSCEKPIEKLIVLTELDSSKTEHLVISEISRLE